MTCNLYKINGLFNNHNLFSFQFPTKYCIAQNFDGGKFWCFWHFPARLSKFNQSNCLKAIQHLQVDSDHAFVKIFPLHIKWVSIHQNFPCQNFALYGTAMCMGIHTSGRQTMVTETNKTNALSLFLLHSIILVNNPIHQYNIFLLARFFRWVKETNKTTTSAAHFFYNMIVYWLINI